MELEEIFCKIFSKYPEEFNTIKLDHYCLETDDEAKFEIFLNIYMLAMTRCSSLIEILETKIPNDNIINCEELIDINLIEENILKIPSKWFNSVGYSLNVSEFDKEILNYDSSEYYCRILLKEASLDYFIKNEILIQYFFLLNSKYKNGQNINRMKALLISPKDNKHYSINFKKLV